jgi:uncharacterized iron-regulated membrane protein
MAIIRQLWKQPQRVWLRRALFQVHLWTGIGAGIYVLLISISGSAIVFRNDIYKANDSPVIHVEAVGPRMTDDEIGRAAERDFPGYEVVQVYEFEGDPTRAAEVRLEKGSRVKNRLINPYTGTDLGSSVPLPIEVMAWFEDLHINLFAGKLGRQINAAGGVLWAVLALSGLVVWWQGIQNWKRGLLVRLKSGWKRLNWDLHSSLGFWTLSLTLMWGLTGVFAAIPDPFRSAGRLSRTSAAYGKPCASRGESRRYHSTAGFGRTTWTARSTSPPRTPSAIQAARRRFDSSQRVCVALRKLCGNQGEGRLGDSRTGAGVTLCDRPPDVDHSKNQIPTVNVAVIPFASFNCFAHSVRSDSSPDFPGNPVTVTVVPGANSSFEKPATIVAPGEPSSTSQC